MTREAEVGASRVTEVLRWPVRVLAVIEAIDALVFMSDQGWAGAEPILVALAVIGLVGAPLTWLSRRFPAREWLTLGAGAFMVAVAPAIIYPLSGLLFIAALVMFVAGPVADVRARRAAAIA